VGEETFAAFKATVRVLWGLRRRRAFKPPKLSTSGKLTCLLAYGSQVTRL
jgi:hypothetical protein